MLYSVHFIYNIHIYNIQLIFSVNHQFCLLTWLHRDFLYGLCHSCMLNNTPFCICHIPTNYSFLKHLGLRFHFLWFLHAAFSINFNIAWAVIIFILLKYHWVQTLLWNIFFVSHPKFLHKIGSKFLLYNVKRLFHMVFLSMYSFNWRKSRKYILQTMAKK